MKTHAIEWTGLDSKERTDSLNPVGNLNSATRVVSRAIVALIPALAMTVGAAWLITMPDLVVYLQATLWASGFVFFGLALESEKATIGLSLATGFALPLLALLSSKVAVEISIIAVALVAAWIAAAMWRVTSAKSPTTGQY
jgi:hypothetical protein